MTDLDKVLNILLTEEKEREIFEDNRASYLDRFILSNVQRSAMMAINLTPMVLAVLSCTGIPSGMPIL